RAFSLIIANGISRVTWRYCTITTYTILRSWCGNNMPDIRVDFNRPILVGRELEYMQQAIANGHLSGDGPFTKECHTFLENELGAKKALLTTSCTHALEMSAILLDVQPGDEVIIPDFTFVSTVNAFVLRGAKPVFVDVRPDTL